MLVTKPGSGNRVYVPGWRQRHRDSGPRHLFACFEDIGPDGTTSVELWSRRSLQRGLQSGCVCV